MLVRRARTQWESIKQELERELEAEALKRNLQNAQQVIHDAQAQLQSNQQDMDIQNSISILHEQTKRDIHPDHDTNTLEPSTAVHHVHVPPKYKHPWQQWPGKIAVTSSDNLESESSLIEHLIELRARLIRMLIGLGLVVSALLPFSKVFYRWLATPIISQLPAGQSR